LITIMVNLTMRPPALATAANTTLVSARLIMDPDAYD